MHWPVVVQMGSPDERIERLLMTLTQTQFASLNNVLQSRCCAHTKDQPQIDRLAGTARICANRSTNQIEGCANATAQTDAITTAL